MKQQIISLTNWTGIIMLAPALMYIVFNITKTISFVLFGLPAEFGYYFVSVDLTILR